MFEKSCTLFNDTKVQLAAAGIQNQFYIFVDYFFCLKKELIDLNNWFTIKNYTFNPTFV